MDIPRKWSLETIKPEALKFNTRAEFKKNNSGAYQAAVRLKVLNIVCRHMLSKEESLNLKGLLWLPKDILKEAKKYKTKWEFKIKAPGAYQKANELGLMNQCFQSTFGHNKTKTRWNHELVTKEALKYTSLDEFELSAKGAFKYAQRHKILGKITKHIKTKRFKPLERNHRLELVLKKARKYQTRTELYENDLASYKFLARNNALNKLDDIYGPSVHHPQDFWTEEAILTEARKYPSRKSFRAHARAAATQARLKGIYEKVCQHMERLVDQRESRLETELIESLEDLFIDTSLNYQITRQKSFKTKESKIIIDVILTIDGVNYPIEVKHDNSSWTKRKIEEQVVKYNKTLGSLPNYKPVTVLSKNGKYGKSLNVFLNEINVLILAGF